MSQVLFLGFILFYVVYVLVVIVTHSVTKRKEKPNDNFKTAGERLNCTLFLGVSNDSLYRDEILHYGAAVALV